MLSSSIDQVLPTVDVAEITLVILIGRRCNLKCTYCNQDAGPEQTGPQLSFEQVESWIDAFCSLGAVNFIVQLHGGEPLIFSPEVELYSAVIRNRVARYKNSTVSLVTIQTNGIKLTPSRFDRLSRAAINVDVTIDGPAIAHDRFRVTASGKPSHHLALRAINVLRSAQATDNVIAIITDPPDVVPAVEFFIKEGFRNVRMNPVRQEGRGTAMTVAKENQFMHQMAQEYMQMARIIADHNKRNPHQSLIEENISDMLNFLSSEQPISPFEAWWIFFIDELGTLWAHPNGYGTEKLRLVTYDQPDRSAVLNAIVFKGKNSDLGESFKALRKERFTVCTECPTKERCYATAGHSDKSIDPLCTWKITLFSELKSWLQEDPAMASFAKRKLNSPLDPVNTVEVNTDVKAPDSSEEFQNQDEQPMHPFVRKILDHVKMDESNDVMYIEKYADFVHDLRKLKYMQNRQIFLQLAVIADQMYSAGADGLYMAFSALADIGLAQPE